jgi:hypothetical protein
MPIEENVHIGAVAYDMRGGFEFGLYSIGENFSGSFRAMEGPKTLSPA